MIDISQICSYSSSPFGKLLLTSDGDALTGVYLTGYQAIVPQQLSGDRKHPLLRETDRQLQAYFAGKLQTFDLPLRLIGTPFQEHVWKGLRDIPFGTTMSYGELARNIGRPSASRAVGAANGRNPISIIVPCHRVIGANGTLVGYGGGLDRKEWLLRHEAKILGSIH